MSSRSELQWVAREVDEDCLEETKTFLASLISFEKAILGCCGHVTPPLSHVSLNAARTLPDELQSFLEYTSQLVEITATPFELFQRASFAFEWMLFSTEEDARSIRRSIFELVGQASASLDSPLKIESTESPIYETRLLFSCPDGPVIAKLKEDQLIEAIYNKPALHTRLGFDFCWALDIALAKEGPEAVVESLYSVMGNQNQTGQLTNENLVLRTKVDWALPQSVSAIPQFIEAAAKRHLKTHRAPIMSYGNKNSHPQVASQVIRRLQRDEGRLPIFN